LIGKEEDDLTNRIYDENVIVHRFEAPIYERIHQEIFNHSTQQKLQKDLLLIRKLLDLPSPSALDIGCGTGNISVKLLKLGFRVTAVDISQEMLGILQEKVKGLPENHYNLRIVCENIDSFLTSTEEISQYDCITMNSVLHHLPRYLNTITAACKLLPNEGLLYISHEPLQKKDGIAAHIHKFLVKADNLPIRLWMLAHRIAPLDYSFSDYYTKMGFDDREILDMLNDLGLKIVFCKKYSPYKTQLVRFLNRFMRVSPTCFKLLARKQSNW